MSQSKLSPEKENEIIKIARNNSEQGEDWPLYELLLLVLTNFAENYESEHVHHREVEALIQRFDLQKEAELQAKDEEIARLKAEVEGKDRIIQSLNSNAIPGI